DKTAWENVAFALYVCGYPKKYIRQRTGELLSQVGLLHKARAYPLELSGGEQQRVAIARALVHSPLLLLADEPTGNLDPNSIDEIMELLIEINSQGTAILMATHNIELVERFGFRVIELAEGRLIGDRPGRKPK
ncbi:cell division ATP-binding protein FtsE, partial [bacterium]